MRIHRAREARPRKLPEQASPWAKATLWSSSPSYRGDLYFRICHSRDYGEEGAFRLHFQSLDFLLWDASLSCLTFLHSMWIESVLPAHQKPCLPWDRILTFSVSSCISSSWVPILCLRSASESLLHGLGLWITGVYQAPLCVFVHSTPPIGGLWNLDLHTPSLALGWVGLFVCLCRAR